MTAHQNLIADNEYQIRLVTLISHAGTEVLCRMLLRRKFSNDETTLYNQLKRHDKELKAFLEEDQYALVFPQNGKTNLKCLDVTILVALIRNCTKIKPKGGWKIKEVDAADLSEGANVFRLRNLRNVVMHSSKLTFFVFNQIWDDIVIVLGRLNYNVHSQEITDLKSGSLNDLENFKFHILQSKYEVIRQKLDDQISKQTVDFTNVSNSLKLNTDAIKVLEHEHDALEDKFDEGLDCQSNRTDELESNMETGFKEMQEQMSDVANVLKNTQDVTNEFPGEIFKMNEKLKSVEKFAKRSADKGELEDVVSEVRKLRECVADMYVQLTKKIEAGASIQKEDDGVAEAVLSCFIPVSSHWQKELCKKMDVPFVQSFPSKRIPSKYRGPPADTIPILGDGNCFFRSLSVAITGVEDHYDIIRTIIVSHMSTIEDLLKPYLPAFYGTLQKYIENEGIDISGSWATEVEIYGAAHFLKTPICIYSPYGTSYQWMMHSPLNLDPSFYVGNNEAIYINHVSGIHYEYVLAVEDDLVSRFNVERNNLGKSFIVTYTDSMAYQEMKTINPQPLKSVACITNGNMMPERMTMQKYKDMCDVYVREYFCWKEQDIISESKEFPPEYILNNEVSKLASAFKKNKHSPCVAITQYNTMEHLDFLQYPEDTYKKLGIVFDNDLDKVGYYKNRILVYNYGYNAIINVRYTETEDGKQVLRQLKNGDEDLRLFCFLHRDVIQDDHICLLNAVAAPQCQTHFEGKTNTLILRKKDIATSKDLDIWIRDKISQWSEKREPNKKIYMEIISSIFGFMATRRLPNVPNLHEVHTHKKIQSVLLTLQQLNVLHMKKRKKIILGGYGSGKTIVGQYHIQLIMETIETSSIIYYICFDENSLLYQEVQRFVDFLSKSNHFNIPVICKNLTGIKSELGLSSVPTISGLLNKLLNMHNDKSLHVILDELDCEMLDKVQAESIKTILHENKILHNSYIVFLPRSMEKRREYISSNLKHAHEKYQYKETGMEIRKLTKCMRTSKKNFALIREAINSISQFKNVINHPRKESVNSDVPKVEQSDTFEPKKENRSSLEIYEQDVAVPESISTFESAPADVVYDLPGNYRANINKEKQPYRKNVMKLPTSVEKTNTEDTSDFDAANDQPEISNADLNPTSDEHMDALTSPSFNMDEIDAIAKHTAHNFLDGTVKTETSFAYHCSDRVGHGIDGCCPTMIFLQYDVLSAGSDDVVAKQLAISLDLLCFDVDEDYSRLFLCNSYYEYVLCIKAMEGLQRDFLVYCPYTNWKMVNQNNELVDDSLPQSYNLITNNKGCRGREAEQVIVFLNPDEKFERQFFIESISRCTGQLYLLIPYVFSSTDVNVSEKTSLDFVVKCLMRHEEKLVKVTLFSCVDGDEEFCEIKEDKVGDWYEINRNSEEYCEEYTIKKEVGISLKDGEDIVDVSLLSSFEPPNISDLKCAAVTATSCRISWNALANSRFNVQQHMTDGSVFELVSDLTSSEYEVQNVDVDSEYRFLVVAVNAVGASVPVIITYEHKYVETAEISEQVAKEIGNKWRELSQEERKENIDIISILLFSPVLFGKSYQDDRWLQYAKESGLLSKERVGSLDEFSDDDLTNFDIIDNTWKECDATILSRLEKLEGMLNTVSSLQNENLEEALHKIQTQAWYKDWREKMIRYYQPKSIFNQYQQLETDQLSKKYDVAVLLVSFFVFQYLQSLFTDGRLPKHWEEDAALDEALSKVKQTANNHVKNGEYKKAIESYSIILRKRPLAHIIYGNRCLCYLKEKRFRSAMSDGKRTVTLNPVWDKGQYRYAQACDEMGLTERALDIINNAIGICENKKELQKLKSELQSKLESAGDSDDMPGLEPETDDEN